MNRTTTIMLKTIAGATLLLAPLAASAQKAGDIVDVTENLKGKVLNVNGTQIYIEIFQNSENRPKGDLTINFLYHLPSGDNYIVEKLAEKAFYYNSDLKSVTLNTAITEIPRGAFQACVNLEKVNYEKGQIETIGSYAFEHTGALTSIDLSGVTWIGDGAFWVGGLTSADLPNVSYIGKQGFREMKSLAKVTIGESCKTINGAAFASCSNLAVATLNYGIKEIGLSNFAYSYELKDFVLPATLTEVKEDVTKASPIERLFILTPSFMDFCDQSKVLEHSGLTEIYALDELLYEIDYYLSINKATKPNLPSIKAKSLNELVEVIPVKGEEGRFTVETKSDDVWRLKIRNSAGDFIYPVADGHVYQVTDGKVMLDYEVNTINHLRYTVELKSAPGGDDNNGDDNNGDDNNGDDDNSQSGIETIQTDSNLYRYFSLQGIELKNPSKGIICIRRNVLTGKTEKIRF